MRFSQILKEVKARLRLLNSFRGFSLLTMVSLSGTLLYLGGGFLGLWPLEIYLRYLYLIVVVNLLAGIGGLLWGYTRRIDLAEALYRIDRKLGLGEKLCTIYDLRSSKERRGGLFLKILYRRIASVKIDPKEAFPFSRADRARLAIIFLLMSCILLASLLETKSFKVGSGLAQQEEQRGEQQAVAKLEEIFSKIEKLQQRLAAGEAEAIELEEVEKLAGELREAQEELWGLTPGRSGGADSGPAGEKTAPGPAFEGVHENAKKLQIQEQREATEKVEQLLSALKEQLEQGGGGNTALQELQEALRRAGEAIADKELRETIQELVQAQDDRQKLLDKALQDIAARKQADRELSQASEALRQLQAQAVQAARARAEETAEARGYEEGLEEGAGSAESEAQKAGKNKTSEGSAAKRSSLQEGRPGEEAGTEPDKGAEGTSQPLPLPQVPEFQPLPISGIFTEVGPIEEIITKGVPFESKLEGDSPMYMLDYPKMEAILQLRNLPPELSAIIKSYFLQITKQVPEF